MIGGRAEVVLGFMVGIMVGFAGEVDSPGRCFARPPSLWQAIKRVGGILVYSNLGELGWNCGDSVLSVCQGVPGVPPVSCVLWHSAGRVSDCSGYRPLREPQRRCRG